MSERIKIKPIEKKKWHEKHGAESFARPVVIHALVNPNTGRYATGFEDDPEKQLELEQKTGLDLSPIFNLKKPHPFWDEFKITLENNVMFLNLDNPLDEIKYLVMRKSKFVANSVEEYNQGLWPEATHVIFNEAEEVAVKAKRVELKQKAYKIAFKLSKKEKINLITIISGKVLSNHSDELIDVEMDKIIEEQPELLISYSNKSKEYLNTKALILTALNERILQKRGVAIYYMDELIGLDEEEAVKFLNDANNQAFKTIIIEKLNK